MEDFKSNKKQNIHLQMLCMQQYDFGVKNCTSKELLINYVVQLAEGGGGPFTVKPRYKVG